jgi:hypothetical protein
MFIRRTKKEKEKQKYKGQNREGTTRVFVYIFSQK